MSGTAFGILTCLQNFGTTILPIAIGYIKDATSETDYGYFYVEVVFISLCMISIGLKFALYKWD